MVASPFLLKTAPPKLGRTLPPRPRLDRRWSEIRDRAAIFVTAPQGFGKTTLLAQWRRRWLEQGCHVAWASLDAQVDRAQFVDLLLFALRDATGRESFATATMQGRLQENTELDTLTALLAEVAALATPTVIVLDDANRMPQATLRELLSYLLHNAPPNLQVLVGSRRAQELPLGDLLARGGLARLDAGDLRLSLEESLDFLRRRLGSRLGLDEAVRLHELTEGWPLGLQLAATTVERAADFHAVVARLSARRGDIRRFFFETLLARLTPEQAGCLVRVSIIESLDPELCAAVTGVAEAERIVEEVLEDSPIVSVGEEHEWLRLHALARDFLLGEFDKLPDDERRACHERAAAWYAEHDQLEDAARHASAAGNESLAVDYAASSLRDIAAEGRLDEARDWIRRLPADVMARDVRLQVAAIWIRAMGDEPASVPGLLATVRRQSPFDAVCRVEAALAAAAAAAFRDRPGEIDDALAETDEMPANALAMHALASGSSSALRALHEGDTERARYLAGSVSSGMQREAKTRLPFGFTDLVVGLSHVWEGNPSKAIDAVRPRLEAAEREMGRRSVVASMLAAVHAAALYLLDDTTQAREALANRLDVIERAGLPDPIILAYRVLADSAARRGDERLALDILQSLHEIGVVRDIPRFRLTSLTSQVRIHLLAGRVETAAGLVAPARAQAAEFEQPAYRPMLPHAMRRLAIAEASVQLSRGDPAGAESRLRTCLDAEPHYRFAPDVMAARALHALAAREGGQAGAGEMLAEIMSLADLRGMRRFVEEAHPRLAQVAGKTAGAIGSPRWPTVRDDPLVPAARPTEPCASGGPLTPKEAQILSLLAVGMANKEIARAMDIGEQTVKWHLKNVFFKLNAASRRHAVDRARVLGLLGA